MKTRGRIALTLIITLFTGCMAGRLHNTDDITGTWWGSFGVEGEPFDPSILWKLSIRQADGEVNGTWENCSNMIRRGELPVSGSVSGGRITLTVFNAGSCWTMTGTVVNAKMEGGGKMGSFGSFHWVASREDKER